MLFALGLSLFAGCSSLGGFDYGDGEADRFTAGDDVPYMPTGDDDDHASTSASPPGPVTGPDTAEPTSTDDGDSADLRPDASSSGDESGSTGETDETGDPADTEGVDTSGTSGPDEPSNLPEPDSEPGSESSSMGGSESTSGAE